MQFINYAPLELEPQILDFWNKHKIVEKLRQKNRAGKKFYFLQGPPYTSGRIHLAHAWNYALKDIALRYKRCQGYNVWDRNGYDVHGLPTEHKVMVKHNLKTKEDIEKFGIGKFIKECEEYVGEMASYMNQDFQRIGCTIDFDDPYMALNNNYMEGEWWLVKKAWEKNRLYLGKKVMTWCANCETALAKHECEYKNVEEDSIFLKFPIKGKKKEFLVIWTTTPWTIPFNLGIMVNPELDYVRAKVNNEIWILGKSLAAPFVQSVLDKKLQVIKEIKGRELEGIEYIHPLAGEVPQYAKLKQKHPNVHTIVLSEEFVDFSAGTGLVHMAPGCGPEDFEIGRKYNIPPFNTLNQKGEFTEDTPAFAGRVAKKDDDKFIDDFQKLSFLVASTRVEHEYPHCWRCKQGVVFRATTQWFFKIEDLKEKMIAENQKVNWVPKTPAFDSWTANLRDNSITRQRYWGTPVPIWKCNQKKCKEIVVVSSIKELEEKAGKVPKDIHRPWIDEVKWKCKCKKGIMTRIPDIIDVWIDAGTASWNCLRYPGKNSDFKKFYPADLILEATEQVRLWFSMLSICSQLSLGMNSYQNVYMHGMIRDMEGQKMSKSLGNIVSPYELIDKHGADVLRYYLCQNNAGEDINFSGDECKTKSRNLIILWNIHKLLIDLSRENKVNPAKLNKAVVEKVMDIEEKYIFSRLNSTITEVTELLEQYRLDEAIAPIEELFLELSRTYIQMIRDKSSVGEKKEKEICIYTITSVLLETLKMFSLIAPFICEAIFLNLKEEFGLKQESISHYSWPEAEEKWIDHQLEDEMEIAESIIQGALSAREKAQLSLRWPIAELIVASKKKEVKGAVEALTAVIKKQVNVKTIKLVESLPGMKIKIKPDYGKIGPVYGRMSAPIIAKLAVDSPETILSHVEKDGSYNFTLNGEKVSISKDMLLIERESPEPYVEAEFRKGSVYLDITRNEELEAEGYAREVMRNIQNLRKKSGLLKLDKIILYLKVSDEIKPLLDKFKLEIGSKIGAESMKISSAESAKKHHYSGTFKIKQEEFSAWFDKI